jgi:NH3-dependent NAD+ synthetase
MPEVKRVLVAMSGGVDSSVAAALLHEAGHELVGVTLHLWDADGEAQVGRCCAPEDRDDARRTCEHLGIPHYVLDERAAFRKHVVDPFISEYQSGRTPIPCVSCNRTVKLSYLAGSLAASTRPTSRPGTTPAWHAEATGSFDSFAAETPTRTRATSSSAWPNPPWSACSFRLAS